MARHTQNQHDQALSADPRRAVQEVLATIHDVQDVYQRETDALNSQNIKGFLAVQDEKLQRVGLYKSRVEQLLVRRSEIKGVDANLKNALARSQAAFSKLSASNQAALKKMQRTTERLGGKIQNMARDSVNKSQAVNYGQSGTFDTGKKKRVSIGVSETA